MEHVTKNILKDMQKLFAPFEDSIDCAQGKIDS